MEARISLITLGVADIARSREFYEALGWTASSASTAEVAFFQGNGLALALWGRAALAGDAEVEDRPSGFSGVALAHSYPEAKSVGRWLLHGWHLWEVAHNPFFGLDEAGNLFLPP